MNEYPFNLRGKQERFSGLGRKDGKTTKSREFELSQGIIIAKIEHHGYSDFDLKFVPTDDSTATTGVAAGATAGAVIGSFIPVLGTIIGGVVGAGIGGAIGDSIAGWKPGGYTGQFSTWAFKQVKEGGEDCLPPGKYRLEVESKDRWTCDFIQPALGQSFGSFDDNANNGDAGIYFWGPRMSGAQLLLATIHHNGIGDFSCAAYSVDGTHHWMFEEEGQFHIPGHQTQIKPGKEYIISVWADGDWSLNFEEAIQGHNPQTLDEKEIENVVFRTIFFMFGKMAKADGQVSKDEINFVDAVMIEFDQDTRKKAIEIFNEGTTKTTPFYEIATEFAQQYDIEDTHAMLECLVALACADGVLHAIEEQYLKEAVTAFGLSPDFLTQAQKNFLFETKKGYKNLIRASFLMFGKMAKADGQVSKEKIDVVDAVMIEFDQDTQKIAIENFNEGMTTTRSFYEIAAEFAQCDTEDQQAILECLLALAYAGGVLHAIEEQYLNDTVTAFGLSPDILTQAREEILPAIIEDYDILGCEPSASNEELKRHYRELSLQYHPDRISSKDLAPDFLKFAKEKFQEIQNAYEAITEHRKMVNNFRSKKNKNLINIFRLYRNAMNCLQNLE